MQICSNQLQNLIDALNSLETIIVLRSNKNIDEREHAITELRYYKGLLPDFPFLSEEDQNELLVQLYVLIEELRTWLEIQDSD